MAAAASMRTWRVAVVAAALACALVLRTVDAAPAAARETPAAAKDANSAKPVCVPGVSSGPCRVATVHDPENQEEEGLFSVRARAPTAAPDTDSDGDYSDPDKPKGDSLVVLGH